MPSLSRALVVVFIPALLLAAGIAPSISSREDDALAMLAVSDNPAEAEAAIVALRAQGPAGLERLVAVHDERLRRGPDGSDPWKRLAAAVDGVAAQRDAYASRLYWHTDLDAAKAAARRDGKPILSLRLLGTLDTELSCANSRFFRTTLYPDPAVSELLRERFVLHWQTVRPVPVVTIDFGDGRTVKRTITGNSAHHVLDADGRPIDVIPGLYSATAFVRELNEALEIANRAARASNGARAAVLAAAHRAALDRTASAYAADLRRANGDETAAIQPAPQPVRQAQPQRKAVPAREAMPRALTKSVVEAPLVASVAPYPRPTMPIADDSASWQAIARLHESDARLSPAVRAVVATKANLPAVAAGERARTKAFVENPLLRMVRNLERSIRGHGPQRVPPAPPGPRVVRGRRSRRRRRRAERPRVRRAVPHAPLRPVARPRSTRHVHGDRGRVDAVAFSPGEGDSL
jgi:hypothetical protein